MCCVPTDYGVPNWSLMSWKTVLTPVPVVVMAPMAKSLEGAVPDPSVPVLVMAAGALALVVAANIAAIGAGTLSARAPAARLLRAE